MIDKKKYETIKVLVIGDSCVDKFIYGDVFRIAPEAPVPIFNPTSTKENKGMAGNVYQNILSIGAKCHLITNEEVIMKIRYVDDRTGQILLRVDENDKVKNLKPSILNQIKNNTFQNVTYDGIIISDYNKGFLTESDIDFLCKNNTNVFMDTKKRLDKWCVDSSYIKINHVEYEHTKYNLSDLGIENKLIITLSDKGCKFKDKIFPVEKVQIKDVSGAGDTFISGLVLEYLRTQNIEKSINFGQKCATIVVQKKGVCTV